MSTLTQWFWGGGSGSAPVGSFMMLASNDVVSVQSSEEAWLRQGQFVQNPDPKMIERLTDTGVYNNLRVTNDAPFFKMFTCPTIGLNFYNYGYCQSPNGTYMVGIFADAERTVCKVGISTDGFATATYVDVPVYIPSSGGGGWSPVVHGYKSYGYIMCDNTYAVVGDRRITLATGAVTTITGTSLGRYYFLHNSQIHFMSSDYNSIYRFNGSTYDLVNGNVNGLGAFTANHSMAHAVSNGTVLLVYYWVSGDGSSADLMVRRSVDHGTTFATANPTWLATFNPIPTTTYRIESFNGRFYHAYNTDIYTSTSGTSGGWTNAKTALNASINTALGLPSTTQHVYNLYHQQHHSNRGYINLGGIPGIKDAIVQLDTSGAVAQVIKPRSISGIITSNRVTYGTPPHNSDVNGQGSFIGMYDSCPYFSWGHSYQDFYIPSNRGALMLRGLKNDSIVVREVYDPLMVIDNLAPQDNFFMRIK